MEREGWGGMGGIGRTSWRDGKDREVLPKGQEESRVSPKGPGGVGRPSQRVGRGQEAHSDGQVVWKPSQ